VLRPRLYEPLNKIMYENFDEVSSAVRIRMGRGDGLRVNTPPLSRTELHFANRITQAYRHKNHEYTYVNDPNLVIEDQTITGRALRFARLGHEAIRRYIPSVFFVPYDDIEQANLLSEDLVDRHGDFTANNLEVFKFVQSNGHNITSDPNQTKFGLTVAMIGIAALERQCEVTEPMLQEWKITDESLELFLKAA